MFGLLFVVCAALLSEARSEEPNMAGRVEMLENLVMQQAATISQLQQAIANNTDQIVKHGAELSALTESKFIGLASGQRMLEYHDKCSFTFNGYCYFGYFALNELNQDGGRLACKQRGAELADIFSEEHYDIAMNFLRQFLPGVKDDSAHVVARTGLTFETSNGITYFSNGDTAPFVKWSTGYPIFTSDREYVSLRAYTVQSSNNGMVNIGASDANVGDAALCQIQI